MNFIPLLIVSLFFCCERNEPPDQKQKGNIQSHDIVFTNVRIDTDIITKLCIRFNELNTRIRDGQINSQAAQDSIRILVREIAIYYNQKPKNKSLVESWVFPVNGYTSSAIGGINGSGYIAYGYNYFDGNKHGGHPAHDIFITDKNQDILDDKTKKHVQALSMTSGVVVAVEPKWDVKSNLRGGKYIWILDVVNNALVYYGHLNDIFVKPGMIVNPGDIIGVVGRTGLNAYKKRSPTHLHISYLKIVDGFPKPINIYNDLLKCKSGVQK